MPSAPSAMFVLIVGLKLPLTAMTPLETAWVDGLAAVLDGGRAPGGVPSTLLDVSGNVPRVLRQGPIATEELLASR